ncbi:MAG: hypothetical protein MI747_20660 [Desulfobacterales bacterium]|nr:hypothetical protein [Desulfobacterales bacterium]
MAEQGVSNERKRELEQNDPFQEFLVKSFEYAKANKKMLGVIAGVLVTVIAIFTTIIQGFAASENKASALYGKALMAYQKEAADPVKAHGLVKDDFKVLLDEYANTSAGRMALVKWGRINLDAGEYDVADQMFAKAYDALKNEAGMKNFILSSQGHVCLAKKDFTGAKAYFQKVVKSDSTLLQDEARFVLATLYEMEKDLAGGLKMYQEILEKNQGSLFSSIAESQVALLN